MVNERMETIHSFFYSVHPIDVSFTFQSLKTSSQLQQPLLLTDRSGYTLFFGPLDLVRIVFVVFFKHVTPLFQLTTISLEIL